ncbi:MAG: hypothetical protein AAB408_02000, partial [Patescibacteria group bacterium]
MNNDIDIAGLLTKQQALLETIVEQNKKIKRHLFWMAVGGYLRLMIIVIPLILGLIFLPPLLRDAVKQYQSFL